MAPGAFQAGLLLAVCVNVAAQETNGTNGTNAITNVGLKVQGQSGRFTLYATAAGENDPNKIVVLMDSLTEVDAQGNAVGTSGSSKHSIQTFATQPFTVKPAEDTKIGDVDASKITFTSPIGSVGEISVDTLIVKGQGIVGPESEQWEVFPGDLKWNIEFPSWTFCGAGATCKQGGQDEIGAFLDLDITVKGSAATSASAAGGNANKYSLGGGVSLLLTKKVMIDGTETEMPGDYPKVEMKGSQQVFKFRFPKFTTSASYDPVIDSSQSESIPTLVGGAECHAPSALALGAVCALGLLTRMFA